MRTAVCAICGSKTFKEADHLHHLIPGSSRRKKADKYGLMIPVCASCHEWLHTSPAEILSKYLGQMMFERDAVAESKTKAQARGEFMREFGENYLWD